jgi:hypothetical protein
MLDNLNSKSTGRYVVREGSDIKELIEDVIIGYNLSMQEISITQSRPLAFQLKLEFDKEGHDDFFVVVMRVIESLQQKDVTVQPGDYLIHKEYYRELGIQHFVSVMQTLMLQRPSTYTLVDGNKKVTYEEIIDTLLRLKATE